MGGTEKTPEAADPDRSGTETVGDIGEGSWAHGVGAGRGFASSSPMEVGLFTSEPWRRIVTDFPLLRLAGERGSGIIIPAGRGGPGLSRLAARSENSRLAASIEDRVAEGGRFWRGPSGSWAGSAVGVGVTPSLTPGRVSAERVCGSETNQKPCRGRRQEAPFQEQVPVSLHDLGFARLEGFPARDEPLAGPHLGTGKVHATGNPCHHCPQQEKASKSDLQACQAPYP